VTARFLKSSSPEPGAEASVQKLARLDPDILVSGHGRPMRGERLRRDFDLLATHFTRMMPRRGRYLSHPLRQQEPVTMLPLRRRSTPGIGTWAAGAAIAAGLWWMWRSRSHAA
jgi:hypothetical protein